MSIIKIFTKKIPRKDINPFDMQNFYGLFSKLSHDLKNNLIAIRASANSINKHVKNFNEGKEIVIIKKAISDIDKKINHTIALLKMTALFSNPICKQFEDVSDHSIAECIQQVIQNYPFPSEKYASSINIIAPKIDFSIGGSRLFISGIFYCLINNALRSIYNFGTGFAKIHLDKSNDNNKMHFEFIEYSISEYSDEYDVFALGTPDKPGNGLNCITKMIATMNGSINFSRRPGNLLCVTLAFPLITMNLDNTN